MSDKGHAINQRATPINYLVTCSCGWSRTFKKQNALARAAKVRAAINEHFAAVDRAHEQLEKSR